MEDFISQSTMSGNMHSETSPPGSTQDGVGDVTSTTGSLQPSSQVVPAVAVVAPLLPAAVSSPEQGDNPALESVTDKAGADEANYTGSTVKAEDPGIIDDKDEDEDAGAEEGKTAKFINKFIDICDLGCCEFCGGPVKKRRHCSPLKRFCSKGCAKSFKKPKKRDEDNSQESEDAGSGQEGDSNLNWDEYMEQMLKVSAPEGFCKHLTIDVPGLKPGMKLEAVDRNNPPSFCVATVIQQAGHRVCIRYDGFGDDDSNDFWCNFQAEELHPIGWCAQNGYPLQPPKGVNSTLEDWRTFLTQTLTGALAAPQDLFRKSQDYFQPRVHGFEVGMKLEAIHPLKPSIICPATVTKSLGPYYFAVTTDYLGDVPSYTFCCHSDSPGIFPINWCFRNGAELTVPETAEGFTKKTFVWEKYIQAYRASVAPVQLFKKVKPHRLKKDMKLEAVDLEYLCVIRVATIANVMGRTLQLFFDGQARFQFIDVDAPDIYPVGWCKRTGHLLSTPFGTIDSDGCKTETEEKIYMPSFAEVMGQQNPSQATQPVGLPRKMQTREKVVERKDDLEELKELKELKDLESADESDLSEDETGSERFYHNKNQIFFNKSCCIGPLLDLEKVLHLPEATPPGKVSSVIRSGLEMVAKAARDPEKVIGLMQEGCGVRVMVRHQGKLLKKAISRVDSRPKLERYLKRFCRRLICCEFFLSLKPVGKPCPDKCKADDKGNLQGPKGLKAKRSREYFEVKHLGVEKKKRGRKRKSELLLRDPSAMKRSIVESNKVVTVGGGPVITVGGPHKPVISIGAAQPKGGFVVSRAVSGTSSTVQPAKPAYQASSSVPSSPHGLPPNSATVATVPHNPLPSHTTTVGPAQGTHAVGITQGLTTQVLNQPIAPMADQGVAKRGSVGGGIVTNISGARFAKNATSAGTTITFGRPPPNVTVSSDSIPPPLTKIGMEGGHPNTCVPAAVLLEGKSQIPAHSTMSMAAASGNPPAPYTSATTAGRPMSGPRPQVSSGIVPRQRLPSVKFVASARPQPPSPQSVNPAPSRPQYPPPQSLNPICGSTGLASPGYPISAMSLPSHRPKQNLTPMQAPVVSPPPLLHTARPPAIPPRGMAAVPTSNMGPGSLPPSRSFQPRFTGNPRGPRPVAVSHPHPMSSPPPLSSASGTLIHHVPSTGPHRTIIPNFHGVARAVASGMPHRNVPTSRESFMIKPQNMGPSRRFPSVPSQRGPTVPMTAITGQQGLRSPSVMQSIPYTTTGLTQQRSFTVTTAQGVPYMNTVTAASVVRTSHLPIHLQSGKEVTQTAPSSSKQAEPKPDQDEGKHSSEGQAQNDGEDPEQAETPKKRNLWWLKKRRKKRSRLTYIKTKYRRKDDDRVPTAAERTKAEMEGEGVVQPYSTRPNPAFEKPKRGRPPKGMASGAGSASGQTREELRHSSDPDWDESEGKKMVKSPVKKRRGRFKKESDSTPAKFSVSPFLPEYHNINTGMVREVGSRLVGTLPTGAPALVVKSPVSPRPQQTAKSPVDRRVSSHLKSPKSTKRSSHFDGKGSHPFSIRSPVRSSASQADSAHIPLYARRSTQTRPLCVDVGTNTSLPGCLNGRSPDLPANPVTWSVEQVVQYVRSTDCGNYAGIFYDQEIDGQSLMLLSRDSLMQFTHMKLGPTLKMCSYIAQLKLRAR